MRVLGVDLGNHQVRAVEVDSAFGRLEIRDYHEVRVSPDKSPAQALANLMANLKKQPDRLVTCLPERRVTFRNLEVPTKDRKAIQAAIRFELEDELPFETEQTASDHTVLTQSRKQTHVHIAASLNRHVASQISELAEVGIDPDIITTEAWAYRAVLLKIFEKTPRERPVFVVQIGDRQTTIYAHHRGVPIISRSLDFGGRKLTEAITYHYGIDIAEAEKAKLDKGFVLTHSQREHATKDQIEFSDVIHDALKQLVSELRQSLLAAKNLTLFPVELLYVSGGGSLLPGIKQMLEEELQTPVRGLAALTKVSSEDTKYSENTDAQFLLALGLGMFFSGADKGKGINFRKGDLARRRQGGDFSLESLKRPLQGAAVVTASLILSLIVQSAVYESQIGEMDQRLEKSIKAFFGFASRSSIRTYLSSPKLLEKAIQKELQKQRGLALLLGENKYSPINFVKNLSNNIPKSVVVDLINIKVGSAPALPYQSTDSKNAKRVVNLIFLIKNTQMADVLETSIKKLVDNVTRSKPEEIDAPDGSGKKFKVTFTGTTRDDAYGI